MRELKDGHSGRGCGATRVYETMRVEVKGRRGERRERMGDDEA